MSEPILDNWRGTIRSRLFVGAVMFLLWAVAIQARLVYLQVHEHEELQSRAVNQSARTMDISAKRGDILDRHGRVLAYSVDSDSVYGVPSEVKDAKQAASRLCAALEDCSDKEREALAARLRQKRAFVYVRRRVTPHQARRIAAIGLEGIDFIKEDRRFYPKKQLAAQLLGFVGVDNTGLSGIEAAYDSQISGALGKLLYQTDARGRAFSRLERPPTAGATVELTIDEYLQHVAERELRDAVAHNRASSGTVIIMDPKTGEILALANEPTFNPNAFSAATVQQRRNRAVQDIYEPGSTFKVVTASAALEERVISPEDIVDVSGGRIRFGARVIDDTHDYGSLTFTDVIVKSSNVGAIKVGLKLGPERLGVYARRFGFGRALSPDFPGETPGIVWDPTKLDSSALASMSMGYQVGVTPLQMVAAISSVANGGDLFQPRVVRALVRDGKRTEVKPAILGRTISKDTAVTLTGIMEQTVERGTATYAQVEGYTIAGKTGTASKLIDGRYSHSDYFASFVGFLPSRDPVASIIVVIDSPHAHGYYGGPIAGPVFQRIAEATLRHFGIAQTLDAPPPVLVARRSDRYEILPVRTTRDASIVTASAIADMRDLPDLRGLSARQALRVLTKIGLSARLNGDGVVANQKPAAGTPIEPGTTTELWLERSTVAAIQ
ncbi:MAG TPA: penicillin-binding protein [Vicinamibacterales bacterium]|nr:penicillin-binding protein [Vicinamibacterales bacterium]